MVSNAVNNIFINQPVTATATNYTVLSTDVIIEVTDTSVARTITLPAPSTAGSGNKGKFYQIKDISGGAGTNNITITPASGLIDGSSSIIIASNYGNMQIFTDGMNYYSSGISSATSLQVNEQVFTSSGTYNPSLGMIYCEIEIVGGGGGGGGAPTTIAGQFSAGAGGGSGEYAFGIFTAGQVGNSTPITIGVGGISNLGSAGGNGGNTSLGALISANGGAGGISGGPSVNFNITGTSGGTGGAGGTYRIPGGAGGYACGDVVGGILFGGFGGNSQLGSGGIVSSASAGFNGLGYGAGGSGGSRNSSSSANSGGVGSSGVVLIKEYTNATTSNFFPVVALAKAAWNQQLWNSGNGFTPGATVVGLNFVSDPGTIASNANSRIDFSGLTQNESSGITIGPANTQSLTITQAGTYQIIGNASFICYGMASIFLQCVRNGSTIIGLGVGQTNNPPWAQTASFDSTIDLNVGDTIDFRVSSPQGTTITFASISLSITQLPTSSMLVSTPWTPFTTTITATGSNPALGAGGTIVSYYMQIGKILFLNMTLNNPSSGNSGSGTYLFNLPPGFTINNSIISYYSSTGILSAIGSLFATNGGIGGIGIIYAYNANHYSLYTYYNSGNSTASNIVSGTWFSLGGGVSIFYRACLRIPVN